MDFFQLICHFQIIQNPAIAVSKRNMSAAKAKYPSTLSSNFSTIHEHRKAAICINPITSATSSLFMSFLLFCYPRDALYAIRRRSMPTRNWVSDTVKKFGILPVLCHALNANTEPAMPDAVTMPIVHNNNTAFLFMQPMTKAAMKIKFEANIAFSIYFIFAILKYPTYSFFSVKNASGLRACNPPFSKRPPFAIQKVTFYRLKDGLLEAKRRSFATHWVSSCYTGGLKAPYFGRSAWFSPAFCFRYFFKKPQYSKHVKEDLVNTIFNVKFLHVDLRKPFASLYYVIYRGDKAQSEHRYPKDIEDHIRYCF